MSHYYDAPKRSRAPLITVSTIVMAILLVISLYLLAGRENPTGSSTIGGSVIPSGPNELISDKNEDGDVRFVLGNMFPGDRETKKIVIGIEDKGVKALCFGINVAAESANFSEVMGITVVAGGETLYDGTVKNLPQILRLEFDGDVEEIEYEISFYLDTSVGNEYQRATLTLDFDWWVAHTDYVAPPVEDGTPPVEDETPPEKPTITIDLTGGKDDCVPWCIGICPWCALLPLAAVAAIALIVALIFLILLLARKKKKKEEERAHRRMMRDLAPPPPPPAPAPVPAPKKSTGGGGYGWAILFGTLSIGSSAVLSSILKQTHKPKKPPKPPKRKKK
ncbi:MAG: hypothetical protein IJW16_04990 [Clostridia bacterium]|nr:hypothetical protein [Clostridia bacterium]